MINYYWYIVSRIDCYNFLLISLTFCIPKSFAQINLICIKFVSIYIRSKPGQHKTVTGLFFNNKKISLLIYSCSKKYNLHYNQTNHNLIWIWDILIWNPYHPKWLSSYKSYIVTSSYLNILFLNTDAFQNLN